MKSQFTLLAILMLCLNLAIAQVPPANTESSESASFGIYGGINFQNINGLDEDGAKLSNSMVTRFHIGLNEEIPIAPEFFIQIGAQFITKGAKGPKMYNDNNGEHLITRELKMNYVEVLVNLAYKPLVGKGHLILGFGPYVGYSLNGKALFSGNDAPSDLELKYMKNVPDGMENNLIYFKRLDVGSNFFFGYELSNGINLVFNSQLGLIGINSNTDSKLVEKNTGFGLSLGYRI